MIVPECGMISGSPRRCGGATHGSAVGFSKLTTICGNNRVLFLQLMEISFLPILSS